jgi:hypothetical protein
MLTMATGGIWINITILLLTCWSWQRNKTVKEGPAVSDHKLLVTTVAAIGRVIESQSQEGK